MYRFHGTDIILYRFHGTDFILTSQHVKIKMHQEMWKELQLYQVVRQHDGHFGAKKPFLE